MLKRFGLFLTLVCVLSAFPVILHAVPQAREGSQTSSRVESAGVGTPSCSARACHGSVARLANGSNGVIQPLANVVDGAIQQNEYTTWLLEDRHAGAYEVLLAERSRKIVEHLGEGYREAHLEPRCLACHTTPGMSSESAVAERPFGVGCESCHGNARNWLKPHTESGWGKRTTAEQKRDLGMTPLDDVRAFVRKCTGCHVGSPPAGDLPARDVNHDLIAAGHPRLAFEFTAFLDNMPHHWRKREDADAMEGKNWLIGQAVSAGAALDLLAHRANDTNAPWPEFSEYDCFSCHHGLAEPSWRRAANPRSFNSAWTWGNWHFAGYDAMGFGLITHDRVSTLRREMMKPDPSRLRIWELSLDRDLRKLFADVELGGFPATTARLQFSVFARATQLLGNWEREQQIYYALVALSSSLPERPRLMPLLDELGKHLAFRQQLNPAEFLDSPQNSGDRSTKMRELLDRIKKSLDP